MSRMIEIDWRPDEPTLRRFGFVALAGFGFLAAMAWQEWLVFAFGLGRARPLVAGAFAVLGATSALFSLLAPKANRPIYLGLTLLAYPIGFVLSHVILALLFFGLITPVGLFFRLMGRDVLGRRFDPAASTYWSDPRPRRGHDSYFRQF